MTEESLDYRPLEFRLLKSEKHITPRRAWTIRAVGLVIGFGLISQASEFGFVDAPFYSGGYLGAMVLLYLLVFSAFATSS